MYWLCYLWLQEVLCFVPCVQYRFLFCYDSQSFKLDLGLVLVYICNPSSQALAAGPQVEVLFDILFKFYEY